MEFRAGHAFIREMRFAKAKQQVVGHKHNFDHITYVVKGALQIEKLNDDGIVLATTVRRASDGFNWVEIKADTMHRITALEDNSIGHCIYCHRTPQGEVVVEYDGWRPAYE